MAKASCTQGKFSKVMREYAKGQLHSGSKAGKRVTSAAQAKAIAYAEARRKCGGSKLGKKSRGI